MLRRCVALVPRSLAVGESPVGSCVCTPVYRLAAPLQGAWRSATQRQLTRSLATRAERKAAKVTAADSSASTGNTPRTVTDGATFDRHVAELLENIDAGLANMKKLNDQLEVVRDGQSMGIRVGSSHKFWLTVLPDEQAVQYATQDGEVYNYRFEDGMWASDRDRHFLLEILTRELMHATSGFPTW